MVFGSLHIEFKKCGQSKCRCQGGLLHGPYVYRRWREGGLQRKAYVPMKRLGEVLLEIERQRGAAPRPAPPHIWIWRRPRIRASRRCLSRRIIEQARDLRLSLGERSGER
jgi:Family of unknown function (DUF6788)